MDPISLILTMAIRNPQATGAAMEKMARPGTVNAAQLETSAADFAREVVNCYHHSARFSGLEVLGGPWQGQMQYGADNSIVMRIYFTGVSGSRYQMVVAAMSKGRQYRTALLQENAMIPYNKNCALEIGRASCRERG